MLTFCGRQSVSNRAAVYCAFDYAHNRLWRFAIRYLLIGIFAVLHLTFASIFGIHLKSWDQTLQGHCYNTAGTSTPDIQHPYVDRICVGVTAFWLYSSLIGAVTADLENVSPRFQRSKIAQLVSGLSNRGENISSADRGRTFIDLNHAALNILALTRFVYIDKLLHSSIRNGDLPSIDTRGMPIYGLPRGPLPARLINYYDKLLTNSLFRNGVEGYAVLRFPLQLYFVITLRKANEHLLNGAVTKTLWGFRQIVALVTLVPMVVERLLGIGGEWKVPSASRRDLLIR